MLIVAKALEDGLAANCPHTPVLEGHDVSFQHGDELLHGYHTQGAARAHVRQQRVHEALRDGNELKGLAAKAQ